jgi:GNAT superfamily N-acetyltransferase
MFGDLMGLRQRARLMLDLSDPRDGLAAYYALYHAPERTQIFIEEAEGSRLMRGFLAVCQTGRDLFRPMAVLRARTPRAAESLLQHLVPGRPYYLVTTPELSDVVEEALEVEQAGMSRVYRLDLRRYTPTLNVLVTPSASPDGSPRFVIRSQGKIAAEAGINWRSPHFVEVYVWTTPEARGRGWGKAVIDGCVSWAIRAGTQPLYIVPEENQPSISLAESVGFVDTEAREFVMEGIAEGSIV